MTTKHPAKTATGGTKDPNIGGRQRAAGIFAASTTLGSGAITDAPAAGTAPNIDVR